MAFRFAYLVLASMIIEQKFYLFRISVDQIIGIDQLLQPFLYINYDRIFNFTFSKKSVFRKAEDAIIFQPETSFRTQIVDLENEDKKSA